MRTNINNASSVEIFNLMKQVLFNLFNPSTDFIEYSQSTIRTHLHETNDFNKYINICNEVYPDYIHDFDNDKFLIGYAYSLFHSFVELSEELFNQYFKLNILQRELEIFIPSNRYIAPCIQSLVQETINVYKELIKFISCYQSLSQQPDNALQHTLINIIYKFTNYVSNNYNILLFIPQFQNISNWINYKQTFYIQ